MKKLVLLGLGLFVASFALAQVQQRYTLSGEMTVDSLLRTPQRITTVYLSKLNDAGQMVNLETAEVKNKCFTFTSVVPEYAEMHFITGFDNGAISFYPEKGDIVIKAFNGQYPAGGRAVGTPLNDLYADYQSLSLKQFAKSRDLLLKKQAEVGAEVFESPAFMPYHEQMFATATFVNTLDTWEFIAKHNDSPIILDMVVRELKSLNPKQQERVLLRSVHPSLRNDPRYIEMVNQVKAANLKVGNDAPDIVGLTPTGEKFKLSDLRGKYILIDFWASWCAPCRKEIPFIKEALAASVGHDNFAVLGVSIDNDGTAWRNMITSQQMTHDNWYHMSDLKGWSSPAAILFGVKTVPKTVLINPNGQVITFDLRGAEMVQKVKRILAGVESYE